MTDSLYRKQKLADSFIPGVLVASHINTIVNKKLKKCSEYHKCFTTRDEDV